MRLRTAAWFALIWFTVPATAIAAQVFVGSTFPTGSGYGLAADIRAYASLVLVAPVACLGAALFGGRLRRSRVLQTERNRRRPAIVYFRIAVLPVLAMSGVVMATMAVTAMSETGGTPIVDPRLGLAAVFQSIAFVLLGMALGLNLPPVVALPCAIVVPYILVAFPPALDIYWLRHVTGISTNCCWVYQDLPARAIAAHILFSISVALVAAATLPVWSPRPMLTHGLVALVAIGTLFAAIVAARGIGPVAVEARSEGPTCRAVSGVQLCLWKDHERARASGDGVDRRSSRRCCC